MLITVGIPTHNEERTIISCIESVINQSTIHDVEIIVVASGCTDNTVLLVENYLESNSNVKLIKEDKRYGKISAINKIIEFAKGDIIIHTDGDVILGKNAIARIATHFQDETVVGVSGRGIFTPNVSRPYYVWTRKMNQIIIQRYINDFNSGHYFHMCGYIMANRRDSLSEIDTNIKGATDANMGFLLQKKGKIVFDKKIYALVKPPNNYRDFIAQKSRTKFGFLKLNKKKGSSRNTISELVYLRQFYSRLNLLDKVVLSYLMILYVYSWYKAFYFLKKDKSLEEIWKPVQSTKVL